MNQNDLRTYCWDSCIFLQHFRTSEPATPSQRQAIRQLLAINERKENIIFVSSVAHLEIVPKKLTLDDALAEEKYWGLFKSRFFYEVPVDAQIIKLGREIRDFYFREADPKVGINARMMDTGDALHLATAIINEADEFHTRDNSKKRGNIPLLDLHKLTPNGLVAGRYPLTIASPDEAQRDWLLDQVENENAW